MRIYDSSEWAGFEVAEYQGVSVLAVKGQAVRKLLVKLGLI